MYMHTHTHTYMHRATKVNRMRAAEVLEKT
jgi:hypothetical protein